jgi:hypothetical protein
VAIDSALAAAAASPLLTTVGFGTLVARISHKENYENIRYNSYKLNFTEELKQDRILYINNSGE